MVDGQRDNERFGKLRQMSWWTPPVGVGVGYGYTAVSMIEAIQRKGVYVWYDKNEPKCHVSFVQPQMYRGTNDQFRIGFTPWESTELPRSWPSIMRGMDEIWTPTQFCVDIFKENDVNDVIELIPHGIDPEVWKINDRYVGNKFTFLHIGGPTERKGAQKVVDAFIDLYDGNKDVQLILKSNGPSEARWRKGARFMGNVRSHSQIKVIEESLSEDDLFALYAKANCLVYPTNGEGFGCIPFQGIATGLPTICTDATGCADFAKMSMPLNSTPSKGVGIHLGDWVNPDEEHLRHLMTDVVENYNDHKNKAMQSARIIHATQTWDHVADMIIARVDPLLDEIAE